MMDIWREITFIFIIIVVGIYGVGIMLTKTNIIPKWVSIVSAISIINLCIFFIVSIIINYNINILK